MGLAGFERARRRLEQAEASASPAPKSAYVKRPEERKPWCAFCDRTFQNLSAYDIHMKRKHPK